MPFRPLAHALVQRFRRGEGGVAALEFAFVLPVMVTMLLGMSEITLAVNVNRKLTLLSRSLADLTARATTTISSDDLKDIFKASTIVMQPFDSSKIKMVLSSMKVAKVGSLYKGSVDWSCPRGTGAVAKPNNVTYDVPAAFQTDGVYYVLVETTLPYKPVFGRIFASTVNLTEVTPWPYRNSSNVTLSSGCPSNA